MLGIYAAIATFWSLPTSILTGTGAAEGLALINSIGNWGEFAEPIIVGQLDAPRRFHRRASVPRRGPLSWAAPSQCISAISRRNGGEAGARYSEFPLCSNHLGNCLNLISLNPRYNLYKHIDVLITIHALILS